MKGKMRHKLVPHCAGFKRLVFGCCYDGISQSSCLQLGRRSFLGLPIAQFAPIGRIESIVSCSFRERPEFWKYDFLTYEFGSFSGCGLSSPGQRFAAGS